MTMNFQTGTTTTTNSAVELFDIELEEVTATATGANFTQDPALADGSFLLRKSYDMVKALVSVIDDDDVRSCAINVAEFLHDRYGEDLSKHVSGSVDAVEATLRIGTYLDELRSMGVLIPEDLQESWAAVSQFIQSSQAFSKSNDDKEDSDMSSGYPPRLRREETTRYAAEQFIEARARELVDADPLRKDWKSVAHATAVLLQADGSAVQKVYEQLCASPYALDRWSDLSNAVRKSAEAEFPANLREAIKIVLEG